MTTMGDYNRYGEELERLLLLLPQVILEAMSIPSSQPL